MSDIGAASRAAVPVSSPRAEASRKNGARSRGPKAAGGKARSARNALKHGLCAQKHVVLPEEDGGEFAALEAELIEELAPVGTLQAVLTLRIAVAAWQLQRADRIEVELLKHQQDRNGDLGLAVIRDGYGAGALATLLRYRGGALAEFTRSLRALKALQAEARSPAGAGTEAAAPAPGQVRPATVRPPCPERPATCAKQPNEPERRENPGKCGRSADRAHLAGAPRDPGTAGVSSLPDGPALRAQPSEPEEAWNQADVARSAANGAGMIRPSHVDR